jgi:hypothetical protein
MEQSIHLGKSEGWEHCTALYSIAYFPLHIIDWFSITSKALGLVKKSSRGSRS